jgi:hypothetical protein
MDRKAAQLFKGCYFEGNNYGSVNNTSPIAVPGGGGGGGGTLVSGCHFKNNGVAIAYNGGSSFFCGIHIEGTEGATPEPQYGIYLPSAGMTQSEFRGIQITGQFEQAGVYVGGGEVHPAQGIHWCGRQQHEHARWGELEKRRWLFADSLFGWLSSLQHCPCLYIRQTPGAVSRYHVCNLVRWHSHACSGNGHGLGAGNPGANITVSGVTPSGYNGTFNGANVVDFHTISYTVANPGGSGTVFGSVFYTGTELFGGTNALEGHTYNVSDANSATWGAAATAGGGSNHVKVRFTPALTFKNALCLWGLVV